MAKRSSEIKLKVTSDTGVARKGIGDLVKRLTQLEKQASRVGAAMNKANAAQVTNTAAMARANQAYQKAAAGAATLSSAILGLANDWMRSSKASNLALRGFLKISIGALKAAQGVRALGRASREAAKSGLRLVSIFARNAAQGMQVFAKAAKMLGGSGLRNLSIGMRSFARALASAGRAARETGGAGLKNLSIGMRMLARDASSAARGLKNLGVTSFSMAAQRAAQRGQALAKSLEKISFWSKAIGTNLGDKAARSLKSFTQGMKNVISGAGRGVGNILALPELAAHLKKEGRGVAAATRRMKENLMLIGWAAGVSFGQAIVPIKNFGRAVAELAGRGFGRASQAIKSLVATMGILGGQGFGRAGQGLRSFIDTVGALGGKGLSRAGQGLKGLAATIGSLGGQGLSKASQAMRNFAASSKAAIPSVAGVKQNIQGFVALLKMMNPLVGRNPFKNLASGVSSFGARAKESIGQAIAKLREFTRISSQTPTISGAGGKFLGGAQLAAGGPAQLNNTSRSASAAQRAINGMGAAIVNSGRGFRMAGVQVRAFFSVFRSFDPSALMSNLIAIPNRISFAFWKLNNMLWLVRRGATAATNVVKTLTAGFADQIQTAEEYHRMRLPIDMLKQLRVVAKMTDASMSEVQVIVKNLNRSLDRAAVGGVNRYNTALKTIGVDMENVRAGTVDAFTVMKKLGAFMAATPPSSPIATEVMSVLGGKGGFRGAPVFSFLARDDFPMLIAATEQLGLELGKTTKEFEAAVDTAHEIKIAFTFVSTLFDGFINQLNLGMGPSVLSALNLIKSMALQIRIAGKSISGEDGFFQIIGRDIGAKFYDLVSQGSARWSQFVREIQNTDNMRASLRSLLKDVGDEFGYWSARVGMTMLALGGDAGVAFGRGFIDGVKDYLAENPLAQVLIGALGGMAVGSLLKGSISIGGAMKAAGVAAKGAAATGAAATGAAATGAAATGAAATGAAATGAAATSAAATKSVAGAIIGTGAMRVLSSKFLTMLAGGLIVPMVMDGLSMLGKFSGGVENVAGVVRDGAVTVGKYLTMGISMIIEGAFSSVAGIIEYGGTGAVALMAGLGAAIAGVVWGVLQEAWTYLPEALSVERMGLIGGVKQNERDAAAASDKALGDKLGLKQVPSAQVDKLGVLAGMRTGVMPTGLQYSDEDQAKIENERDRMNDVKASIDQMAAYSQENLNRKKAELDLEMAALEARRAAGEDVAADATALDAELKLAELTDFQSQLPVLKENIRKAVAEGFTDGVTDQTIINDLNTLFGDVMSGPEGNIFTGGIAGGYEKYSPETGQEIGAFFDFVSGLTKENFDQSELDTAVQNLINRTSAHAEGHEIATTKLQAFSQALAEAKFAEKLAEGGAFMGLAIENRFGATGGSGEGNFMTKKGLNQAMALAKQSPNPEDIGAPTSSPLSQGMDNLIKSAYANELAGGITKLTSESEKLTAAATMQSEAFEELTDQGYSLSEAQAIVAEQQLRSTQATNLGILASEAKANGDEAEAERLGKLAAAYGELAIAKGRANVRINRDGEAAEEELRNAMEAQAIRERYGVGFTYGDLLPENQYFDTYRMDESDRQMQADKEIALLGVNDPTQRDAKSRLIDYQNELRKTAEESKRAFAEMSNDVFMLGGIIENSLSKGIDALFEGDFDSLLKAPQEIAKDFGKTWFKAILKDKLKFLDIPIKANFFELGKNFQTSLSDGGTKAAKEISKEFGKTGIADITDSRKVARTASTLGGANEGLASSIDSLVDTLGSFASDFANGFSSMLSAIGSGIANFFGFGSSEGPSAGETAAAAIGPAASSAATTLLTGGAGGSASQQTYGVGGNSVGPPIQHTYGVGGNSVGPPAPGGPSGGNSMAGIAGPLVGGLVSAGTGVVGGYMMDSDDQVHQVGGQILTYGGAVAGAAAGVAGGAAAAGGATLGASLGAAAAAAAVVVAVVIIIAAIVMAVMQMMKTAKTASETARKLVRQRVKDSEVIEQIALRNSATDDDAFQPQGGRYFGRGGRSGKVMVSKYIRSLGAESIPMSLGEAKLQPGQTYQIEEGHVNSAGEQLAPGAGGGPNAPTGSGAGAGGGRGILNRTVVIYDENGKEVGRVFQSTQDNEGYAQYNANVAAGGEGAEGVEFFLPPMTPEAQAQANIEGAPIYIPITTDRARGGGGGNDTEMEVGHRVVYPGENYGILGAGEGASSSAAAAGGAGNIFGLREIMDKGISGPGTVSALREGREKDAGRIVASNYFRAGGMNMGGSIERELIEQNKQDLRDIAEEQGISYIDLLKDLPAVLNAAVKEFEKLGDVANMSARQIEAAGAISIIDASVMFADAIYTAGAIIEEALEDGIQGTALVLRAIENEKGENFWDTLTPEQQDRAMRDEEYAIKIAEAGYQKGFNEVDENRVARLIPAANASMAISTSALDAAAETSAGTFADAWTKAAEEIAKGLSDAFKSLMNEQFLEGLMSMVFLPVTEEIEVLREDGVDWSDPEQANAATERITDKTMESIGGLEALKPVILANAKAQREYDRVTREALGLPSREAEPYMKAMDAMKDSTLSLAEIWRNLRYAIGETLMSMIDDAAGEVLGKMLEKALTPLTDIFEEMFNNDNKEAGFLNFMAQLPMAMEEVGENLDMLILGYKAWAKARKELTEDLIEAGLLPDPEVEAWLGYLDDFKTKLNDSLQSGIEGAFSRMVNNPELSRGEVFAELGRSMEREIYSSMLTAIIRAAIAASALSKIFELIGGLIAQGIANGFTEGMYGALENLMDAAGAEFELVMQYVEPVMDRFAERAYKVEESAVDSADQLNKTSCALEYRSAEQRAGAAMLSSLGREGNVYGGVAMGSAPGTFTPFSGGNTGGGNTGGGNTGGGNTGGGNTGGGNTGGGGPSSGQGISFPEFINNYSNTPQGERSDKYSWDDPVAFMAEYGLRSKSDIPMEPVDPALMPPVSSLGGWGRHFVEFNADLWNSLSSFRGHGYNDYAKLRADYPSVVDGLEWFNPYPGVTAKWWGSGSGDDPNWKSFQHQWVNEWADTTLWQAMLNGGWPRQFAEGGVVTGAMMGIVGEAGPEAIIPLSRINEVTDTIYSGTKSESNNSSLAEEIAEMRAAISELAEAIGEQPIETTVAIDGKAIVKATSRKAKGLSKGNAYIIPSNTVK